MMRWGLVPSTTKGPEFGPGAPSAIAAIGIHRRLSNRGGCMGSGASCRLRFLYLAANRAGLPQPSNVRLVNRPVFGVAALWDRS